MECPVIVPFVLSDVIAKSKLSLYLLSIHQFFTIEIMVLWVALQTLIRALLVKALYDGIATAKVIEMIRTTTSNSTKVKPFFVFKNLNIKIPPFKKAKITKLKRNFYVTILAYIQIIVNEN